VRFASSYVPANRPTHACLPVCFVAENHGHKKRFAGTDCHRADRAPDHVLAAPGRLAHDEPMLLWYLMNMRSSLSELRALLGNCRRYRVETIPGQRGSVEVYALWACGCRAIGADYRDLGLFPCDHHVGSMLRAVPGGRGFASRR
jgi:hypothetical protein